MIGVVVIFRLSICVALVIVVEIVRRVALFIAAIAIVAVDGLCVIVIVVVVDVGHTTEQRRGSRLR